MNFKTTLALLALLVVVAAYFVFFERGSETGSDVGSAAPAATGPGEAVFTPATWRAEEVDRLVIERAGRSITLARQGDAWQQVEPVRFALSAAPLAQLARDATGLRHVDRFEPGGEQPERAAVGLDPAQAVVRVHANGQLAATIHLGRTTLGGRAYAMIDDDPRIYVVGDALHKAVLNNRVADWRERTLGSPDAAKLSRVVLEHDDASLDLRKHEGRWFLDAAHVQRADEQRVRALVTTVRGARIEQFVGDEASDLATLGLHRPRVTLRLELPRAALPGEDAPANDEPGQVYTLRVGAPADLEDHSFYATWSVGTEPSPVVFTLRNRDVEALRKSADDFRDPHLVASQANELRELKVVRADGTLMHLLRDPNRGFIFGEPAPGFAVDYHDAEQLLGHVAALKAVGFVPDFEPTDEPLATLELTRRGGGEGVRIALHETAPLQTDDGPQPMYLAVRDDEPVAYRVPAGQIAPLLAGPGALRDRQLLDLPAEQIIGVSLSAPALGADYQFVRGDDQGAWQLVGHDRFEREAFAQLIERVRLLRVRRWLGGSAALGDDAVTLTLEQADGPTRVLHVDPQTGQARLEGHDSAFELEPGVVEMLQHEYRERTVLPVRAAQLASVTVTDGSESLTVRRSSEGRYTLDTGETIEPGAAGALFDALAGLRVRRYAATMPTEQAAQQLVIRTSGGEELTLDVPTLADGADAEQAVLTLWGELNGQAVEAAFTVDAARFATLSGAFAKSEVEGMTR